MSGFSFGVPRYSDIAFTAHNPTNARTEPSPTRSAVRCGTSATKRCSSPRPVSRHRADTDTRGTTPPRFVAVEATSAGNTEPTTSPSSSTS